MVLKYGGVLTHAGRKQVLIIDVLLISYLIYFAYIVTIQGLLR
jgi:hypothetical protein